MCSEALVFPMLIRTAANRCRSKSICHFLPQLFPLLQKNKDVYTQNLSVPFDPTIVARFSHQNLQLVKYKISEGESTYCNQTREDMAATSRGCYVTSSQDVIVYAPKLSRILPPLPVRLQKLKDVAWWHSPTSKVRLSVLWCCFCPGVGSCCRPALLLLLHDFWAQMH